MSAQRDSKVSENFDRDLRLHRKYLLVVNFIIWLYIAGGVNINEFSLLGTKMEFQNPWVLFVGLLLILFYSYIKYYQFHNAGAKSEYTKKLILRFRIDLLKTVKKKFYEIAKNDIPENGYMSIYKLIPDERLDQLRSFSFMAEVKLAEKGQASGDLPVSTYHFEYTEKEWEKIRSKIERNYRSTQPQYLETFLPFRWSEATLGMLITVSIYQLIKYGELMYL